MTTNSRIPGVCEWAEAHWRLEDGALIGLRPWQRAVLEAMFPPDGSESEFETFLISTIKKAGKTELNAIATLYAALTWPAPETVYVVANDEAQARERVFDRIARVLRSMGLVQRQAVRITASEITFTETGTKIIAVPADFAGAAGAVFGVSSWTETWAFRHESHIRLWEELTPIPNRRSLRILDSYAGFTGDAPVLEPIWERAIAGEQISEDPPIFANGKLLALIDTGEEAQARAWLGAPEDRESYYAEQRASLRPASYARLHLNRWQTGTEAFITAEEWDRCVSPEIAPVPPGERHLTLAVGVDAATKHDAAAVVAVALDAGRTRLVRHRVWTPRKGEPLDLEATVEAYLMELKAGYRLSAVYFDPFQMARSAATLGKVGLPMREWPQTVPNLTASSQHLFELIREGRLIMYPDDQLRQHALNATAVESGRGWRLAKEKSSKKIDAVVALSFACRAALDYADRSRPAHSISLRDLAYTEPTATRGEITLTGRQYFDVDPDGKLVPPPGWTDITTEQRSRAKRNRPKGRPRGHR